MTSYQQAGVDISAATRATEMMTAAVRSTYTPAVLAGMGPSAAASILVVHWVARRGASGPILVASTDGVGTKTMIADAVGRYDSVGADLVNHCANDILAQGARPLFFLDYVAAARIAPQQVAALVTGVANACRAIGCALLGGETAEMPGIYHEGAFDLAGTIIGVVERERMLPRDVGIGDAILALPSNGLHTNGYSLARRLVEQAYGPGAAAYAARPTELGGRTVGEALLEPHRCYLHEVEALWEGQVPLRAIAHITGGGLYDNLPRVLPGGAGALIRRETWEVPPIFELLVQLGGITEREAFHTFNMGLGMLLVVPADAADAALKVLPEARLVGQVVAGESVELV